MNIAVGAKAMCHVIMEKACDESKTAEERIDDIKQFCEISLKNEK